MLRNSSGTDPRSPVAKLSLIRINAIKGKNSRLAAALAYARLGWRVEAVHSVHRSCCSCGDRSCPRAGKHPCTEHGVKDATIDPGRIRQWWQQFPAANIGVATGVISGIVAIDVDPRNGGVATLKTLEAEHGSLRNTTTSITGGGGRHFIFAYPGFTPRKTGLGPGIDVLADGQYIVVPPSTHVSGKPYLWVKGRDPLRLPPQPLPDAYRKLLQPVQIARVTGSPGALTPDPVTEGHRNQTLTKIGGQLRRAGLGEAALRAALLAENEQFAPPLEHAEVERIVGSLLRYPSASEAGVDDPSWEFADRVLITQFAGGDHLICENDTCWYFDKTHWSRLSDIALQQKVLQAAAAGGLPKGSRAVSFSKEVVSLIKARRHRTDDLLRFRATPLPIINCRNGELWLGKDGNVTLKQHSPASGLRYCLDIDYDPGARCPKYDEALLEIFSKSGDPYGMAAFWDAICGYVIQPDRSYAIVLILWGTGSNAKSSLTETLTRLLGKDLVYAGPVQRLSESRFGYGDLVGKLLFLDDDVPAGAKLPDGALKTISEAKLLTGEEKYKPAFNFTCRTVPILLCNSVPSLADLSYGMQRRLIVVPFDRRFGKREIKRALFPEIWENEMPGVLNRKLAGYRTLVQHNALPLPDPVKAATSQWIRQANPVSGFVQERCLKDPKGRTLLASLYDAFCDWAKRAGITRIQQCNNFRRNLDFLGFEIRHTNRGAAVFGLVLRPATPNAPSPPAW